MATKLVQSPIPAHKVLPPISTRATKKIKSNRLIPATHSWTKSTSFRSIYTAKVAEQSSGLIGDDRETRDSSDKRTLTQIKTELLQVVQGINRGIFGVPSAKKSEIEALVELLESQNPTPHPTANLDKVGGTWKLVYSTITILGSKRTKLGLRDFITLGDFFQSIDVAKGKAVNVIKFNVRGLNLLNGQLTIEASFKIASKSVKASILFCYFDSNSFFLFKVAIKLLLSFKGFFSQFCRGLTLLMTTQQSLQNS
ncbi:hypothetical protein CICLE_v10026263mg [Citrus x clementina]|uniref:Plastid lipid-associated protein/fibrillin conserved domain-containing protein n=1 Tax=Citrus clementina TaxID=85681 RepID=V4SKH1_CITCL|nr:hypothetical protein CICLE_v10026263mg [Citrus x clementina]